jgi:hypothetical protein
MPGFRPDFLLLYFKPDGNAKPWAAHIARRAAAADTVRESTGAKSCADDCQANR